MIQKIQKWQDDISKLQEDAAKEEKDYEVEVALEKAKNPNHEEIEKQA